MAEKLTEEDAYNVAELGYKMNIPEQCLLVRGLRAFHGRCGGALDGACFKGTAVYFAASGELASAFAEHIHMNRDCEVFGEDYLDAAPAVFPVLLTFENPVVFDRDLLRRVATELGVKGELQVLRFIKDFEDSNEAERGMVFNWARWQGHDGAVILNDLMPVCAGGDWAFRTSYVSFEPEKQVKFCLACC